ncbi:unnamed protein product [Cylicocyclus nassatus]|uniref:Serpin domain-containing protein n=1 Tax=Cylicocyclus nassatus TaxID=53992 RepID=A0AA36DL06_CYLNA|nr:unnamed protein product [Cylicocyclus nassatus]
MADFAVDLLKLIPVDESMVMSPLSLIVALDVLERGADGITKREINEALKRDSKNGIAELLKTLDQADGVATALATKLFLALDVEIRQDYNDYIQNDYKVVAEHLDFKDKILAIETVNNFVAAATRKMIPKLLNDDYYHPEMRALLINAVHFKGLWAAPFSAQSTRKDTFHGIKGDREELFMRYQALEFCGYNNEEGTETLTIPYKNGKYRFVIFLPAQNRFEEFRSNLDSKVLRQLHQNAKGCIVDVTIPKIKLSSEPPMKEMLQQLGIRQLFSENCDLKGVSNEESLYIDDVIHKAVVEVNEEGTEAAAVTAATVELMSCVINPYATIFRADRPFIYGIYCNDEPIFIGQYC